MGIFYEATDLGPSSAEVIRDALRTAPEQVGDIDAEAQQRARQLDPPERFQTTRFLVALGVFAVVVAAAIGTDAADLADSSKALYGFAATIFGVIAGLLGGEKAGARKKT